MKSLGLSSSNTALDLFLIQLAGRYSISRTYSAREVIFAEGDPGNTMHLILDGSIRVTKKSPESGEPVVIAHRSAGDFLGEMALVEESPRFATASAETDCEVLEFSKDNFEKIIREQPALATRVLKSLSTKLRESDSLRIVELEESNRQLTASNRELIRLNSFLDCVIDQSPSAVFLTTRGGKVFRMNKAASRMFSIEDPEAYLDVDSLFKDLDFEKLRRRIRHTWTGELRGQRSSEEFPVYLSVTTLSGHNNSILYLMICQDISELHAFNEIITEFEKYASAQETAVELTHDLKNYLGVLLGNMELLISQLTPDQRDDMKRPLEAIGKTSQEVLQFIENVMAYREDRRDVVPVDVRALVRAIVRFCQPQARFQDVEIEVEIEPKFPDRIFIKQGQLQSVLVNLLVNAAEAMDEAPSGQAKKIAVTLARSADNDRVIISIIDNGPGIAEEHLPRVFKKRFTTKATGHGIGLVSIAKIVEAHSGEIAVESALGGGAKFEIKLPIKVG